MNEENNNSNTKLMTNLKKQVNEQISTLTTKIPAYSELNDEGKKIVDKYISSINLHDSKTIDEFGKKETEKIYKELDILIGTLKTHDTSIEDMFAELMLSIDENIGTGKESFSEALKKSPLAALRVLKNKPKKMIANEKYRREMYQNISHDFKTPITVEKYRRAKVLTNIDVIQEKLESIRSELRTNAGKLEIMAQNSAEQYVNTQYQIIALQEVLKKLQSEKESEAELTERTFSQIDQSLQLVGVEKRIGRKIDNCKGVSINAATKAIMSRLLAQHNEELASDYDQDLSSLLPELKGIVVTAEANDSLIQAVDTHNQFVNRMNEMLRTESERSKDAIKKVQDISSGSAIDVETARVLTSNVLEVVNSLKQVQQAGKTTNEAFTEILDDFRGKLAKEIETNNSQENTVNNKERD